MFSDRTLLDIQPNQKNTNFREAQTNRKNISS